MINSASQEDAMSSVAGWTKFAIVGLMAVSAPARAQDTKPLSADDILGVWAADCSTQANAENVYTRWDQGPAGSLIFRVSAQADWPMRGLAVMSQSGAGNGLLRLGMTSEWRHGWSVTYFRTGAKIRVIEALDESGRAVVQTGIVLQSGLPTKPLERCASP
jgi:hypothetical protein